MAKTTNYWYLVTWTEMDRSQSWADLPLTEKITPANMQNRQKSLNNLVSSYLGRQIMGVTSFSYYGSETVRE